MECIVLINDNKLDTLFTLHRDKQGYPKYTGEYLKHILGSFPYDKIEMTSNLLISELESKGFDIEYSIEDHIIDEENVDESLILPNKYIYIITINDSSVLYECKRIDSLNFPDYKDLSKFETIETKTF